MTTTKPTSDSLLELFDSFVSNYPTSEYDHDEAVLYGYNGESARREPIDAAVRLCIEALEEMADFDNPNELKYIASPKAQYMAKSREALTALRAALQGSKP